jgi:Sec-independent protein translocase protein TatA
MSEGESKGDSPYQAKDLKQLLDSLGERLRAVKGEIQALEKSEQEADELATDNARLKRETVELQARFAGAIAVADEKEETAEGKYMAQLIEIYRLELDRIKATIALREKASKASGKD